MKRKLIAFVTVLCMVLTFFPAMQAAAIPGEIRSEGNWTAGIDHTDGRFYGQVLKYKGSSESVTVPEDVAGHFIESVGTNCFDDTTVERIYLNEHIIHISSGAFAGCDTLERVYIKADSVRVIGSGAFIGLENLEKVSIQGYIRTLGYNAFKNCTALETIDLSNGVYQIGDSAFAGCTALKEVKFGKTEIMGEKVFSGCNALKSVVLPEGLKDIEKELFLNCTSLKSVTIPKTVYSISPDAFNGCTALTEFVVEEGSKYYYTDSYGVLYFKDFDGTRVAVVKAPVDLDGSYVIPENVTKIYQYAFVGCTELEEVTIPAGITAVDGSQFAGCVSLRTIRMEGEPKLKDSAFTGVNAQVHYGNGEAYRYEDGKLVNGWTKSENTWTYTGVSGMTPEQITVPAAVSTGNLFGAGTTLKITVPESGEVIVRIPTNYTNYANVVVKHDGNGNQIIVPETYLEDQYVFVKLRHSGVLAVYAPRVEYTDISSGFWAWNEISFMSARNLLSGKLDGSYAPQEVITRNTVAMVLWRIAGRPQVAVDTKLSDVNLNDRYTQAICWAEDAGIITGYADGTFRGEDTLTRQHLAVMLYRFAAYKGIELEQANDLTLAGFPDGGETYSWAREAMEWAVNSGLINGRASGKLDALGDTSRAQLAVILTRFLQQYYAEI